MDKRDKERLTSSFRSWGKMLLGRAVRGAEEYGILCSSSRFSDGKKG